MVWIEFFISHHITIATSHFNIAVLTYNLNDDLVVRIKQWVVTTLQSRTSIWWATRPCSNNSSNTWAWGDKMTSLNWPLNILQLFLAATYQDSMVIWRQSCQRAMVVHPWTKTLWQTKALIAKAWVDKGEMVECIIIIQCPRNRMESKTVCLLKTTGSNNFNRLCWLIQAKGSPVWWLANKESTLEVMLAWSRVMMPCQGSRKVTNRMASRCRPTSSRMVNRYVEVWVTLPVITIWYKTDRVFAPRVMY